MYRPMIVILTLFLAAGCAAVNPQSETDSSAILPIEIQAALKPGQGAFAPDQFYLTAAASRAGYDKILLDPLLYYAPLEQMRLVSSGDRQILLNNFYILLNQELAKDFTIVRYPQPGAARVQFALLPVTRDAVALDTVSTALRDADESAVVRDLLASPLLKGRAFIVEAEWTDSLTGEVLGATVDRHFGRKTIDVAQIRNWADVNLLLQDYAALVRYRLCRFRDVRNCIEPPAAMR